VIELPKAHIDRIKDGREAEETKKILKKLQNAIVENHERVTAIICIERIYCKDYRYRYFGSLLLGKAVDSLSDNFWMKFNNIEKSDILEI